MNVVTLVDPDGTTEAKILVDFGFNCFQLRTTIAGHEVDALWAHEKFAEGGERASGSGIPLLFPFPGRLCGSTFRWEDATYEIAAGDGRGNAIHGFVLDRPWRVIEQTSSSLLGEFQASVDDPDILEQWPADFCIRVRYSVAPGRLSSEIEIENPDQRPLPWGLGTHGYFAVPLAGSSADECLVQLPAAEEWELDEMLPTGRRLPVANSQLRQGAAFASLQLDNVFTGLEVENGESVSSIRDPHSGLRLVVSADQQFRELVVYTPPHREAICIEPYTMAAAGWDLHQQGKDIGVRVLPPGEKVTLNVNYRLEVD